MLVLGRVDTQDSHVWKEIHFPNISKPSFFGFYVRTKEGMSDVCYVQDIENSTISCTVSNLQSIPTVDGSEIRLTTWDAYKTL